MTTDNADRAREIWRRSQLTAHDWPDAIKEIAAALDAAEARGRNQALQSEQHRTDVNVAFEEGRAEGERAGLERVAQHFKEVVLDAPSSNHAVRWVLSEIRLLQRGAGETEKGGEG